VPSRQKSRLNKCPSCQPDALVPVDHIDLLRTEHVVEATIKAGLS
jgi:hypothetical protein